MKTFWIEVQAPFAAYRHFQAGVYRTSAPVMTPSAAWGLVLNLAAIEVRTNNMARTTEIDPEAPRLKLAIGIFQQPERCSLYQQLHSYPVGSSGKDNAARTYGGKYWIAPVRREILIGLHALIGVQSEDPDMETRVRKGLAGEYNSQRYGLPFAGDNNLLFDQINLIDSPRSAYWYYPLQENDGPKKGATRLSVSIDRVDSSRTVSKLFAPTDELFIEPPDESWVWTPRMPVN